MCFGPRELAPTMKFGQEVVYAFGPGGSGCLRVPDCDLSTSSRRAFLRTGTLKPGWQVTIEWELELGMGTTAINGNSELSIETYDRAHRRIRVAVTVQPAVPRYLAIFSPGECRAS